MSVVLLGSTSGSITLQEPAVAGTNTVNFGANTGVAILDANTPAFRNRLINSAMRIDQRNAGASFTISAAGTSSAYVVDRFWFNNGITSGTMAVQRSTTAPTEFVNSVLITNNAAVTATSTQNARFWQPIEGFNTADLNWGTANAKTVTLSFWVRSSLTGTFAGGLLNNGLDRSYVFTYDISSANTWEYKTVTITGDTSGTWTTDNTVGIYVAYDLGSGSNRNGTAGSWASAYAHRTSGSVNLVGTNGATFYITGVQLEKGSTATSFDYRSYGTELALAQRYFAKMTGSNGGYCAFGSGRITSATNADIYIKFPTSMRGAPTVVASNTAIDSTVFTATTTINAQYRGLDSALCSFTISGSTAGQGANLIGNNNVAAFISLDAEL